jgi:hypothetical protein
MQLWISADIHNAIVDICSSAQFTLWISAIRIVDYPQCNCAYPQCGLNVNFAPIELVIVVKRELSDESISFFQIDTYDIDIFSSKYRRYRY